MKTIAIHLESPITAFSPSARQITTWRKHLPNTRLLVCRSEAAFLRALPKADIAWTWVFDAAWFARAPRLRLLVTPAAGHESFPHTHPPHVRVVFCTFHGIIMAESVIGMMLARIRGLYTAYEFQHANVAWPRDDMPSQTMTTLDGTHAIILGFGNIGQAVARRLKAFNVRITGVRRHRGTKPAWLERRDRIITSAHLDDALATADHVICTLPSDTNTDHILGAAQIARLPRHAVVYNVGRGNCIDEIALAQALTTHAIAGASLDVFATEPLSPESPLLADLPGLIRTPHCSAFAPQYLDLFFEEIIARKCI